MKGDPVCPHCRAPQPVFGETRHGRMCPLATDRGALQFQRAQLEAAARERERQNQRYRRWALTP